MKNKSVMVHDFSRVPSAEMQRSSFDRSHGIKTTFDAGYLVPIFVDEALPGDTFNLNMTGFARMATPIFPIMDNLRMETFYFSVPIRLLWDNWKRFNGEQTNPGDSTDYIIPTMTSPAGGYLENSFEDYIGLPVGVENIEHSALWHRAHNKIFNEWFRDQNLQNARVEETDDGPDSPENYEIWRRGKRHDYFTSCLPWPQKGDAVTIPTVSDAPIIRDDLNLPDYLREPGTDTIAPGNQPLQTFATGSFSVSTGDEFYVDTTNWQADMSQATATTINALRQAFQIQKLLERDARGGTRYTEIIRSHFNVISPDQRQQRPEYLGGGSSPLQIIPVPQTSQTDSQGPGTPQGTLAATATATLKGHGFTKSFTEHCILIGYINVRADLTYQQGMNRMFSRSTRFDFYWPTLSHLGEQAVLNQEIYTQGNAEDQNVFGYQERYAEYRYKPSMITGQFRSTADEPLDSWHLSQEFDSLPQLNEAFIEETPPMDRVIAVPSEPDFILDVYNHLRCARPMPLYGVPGLIDHF